MKSLHLEIQSTMDALLSLIIITPIPALVLFSVFLSSQGFAA
jgi:hypothetical protein